MKHVATTQRQEMKVQFVTKSSVLQLLITPWVIRRSHLLDSLSLYMVRDANLRMGQTAGLVHKPNTPYVFRVGAACVCSGGTSQFPQPQHEGCVKTIRSFYCFAFGFMSVTPCSYWYDGMGNRTINTFSSAGGWG